MPLPIPFDQLAKLLRCPAANLATHWPLHEQCLLALGHHSPRIYAAALATITVETAYRFEPIKEYGGLAYLQAKPYWPYFGRGTAQLTWEYNYRLYGKRLGIDLVADPDKALEPSTAAAVFAAFWHDKRCSELAEAEDWKNLRKRWNGGLNGYSPFLMYTLRVLPLLAVPA